MVGNTTLEMKYPWSTHTMFANSLLLPFSCDCSCKLNSITTIAYHHLKPLLMPVDTKIQRYKVNVAYLYLVPVWNSIGESSFKSRKTYDKSRSGVLKASKIN